MTRLKRPSLNRNNFRHGFIRSRHQAGRPQSRGKLLRRNRRSLRNTIFTVKTVRRQGPGVGINRLVGLKRTLRQHSYDQVKWVNCKNTDHRRLNHCLPHCPRTVFTGMSKRGTVFVAVDNVNRTANSHLNQPGQRLIFSQASAGRGPCHHYNRTTPSSHRLTREMSRDTLH